MKRVFTFMLVIILCCSVSIVRADENIDYTGRITLDLNNVPTFKDFLVPVSGRIKIADDIDWGSHPNAWHYRTRLRSGLKNGPNFAGKYAVVMHGCGTSCQIYWVINVETGKVLKSFLTTYGADFRRDSRLIIRNAPENSNMTSEEYPLLGVVDYYKVWDDELVLIKRFNLGGLYEDNDN